MNYTKIKGTGTVQRVLRYVNRGIDSPDIYQHSDKSIDSTRTYLNYDLKDRNGQNPCTYFKERFNRIAKETKKRTGRSLRSDAVLLCSWIITAPKDLPEEHQHDFFQFVYEWFSKRYGEDNVVEATVHMDETTPHMHMQFIPLMERNGVQKLCAKELETRSTLKMVHPEMEKYLTQKLGFKVSILNGATKNGNKTILELKNETLQHKVEELQQTVKELEHRIEELTKNHENL